MANYNGFFGNIQGPFNENTEILTLIQEQCKQRIKYISKLGIVYTGDINLEVNREDFPKIIAVINNIQFRIGKTKMLELEDVHVTSIKLKTEGLEGNGINFQDISQYIYIDYQYVAI